MEVDKDLLMLKAFYLLFYAGIGTFVPFVPVYLQQTGLSATETGIIIGFLPFISCVSGPVTSWLVDRYRLHKPIFVITCVLTGFTYACLQLIPRVDDQDFINRFKGNTMCEVSNATLCFLKDYNINTNFSTIRRRPEYLSCQPNKTNGYATSTFDSYNDSIKTTEVTFNISNITFTHDKDCIVLTRNITFLMTTLDEPCLHDRMYECEEKQHVQIDLLELRYDYKFWSAFVILTLARQFLSLSTMITDAVALNYLHDKKSLFGHQRMFGSIGFVLISVPMGVVLQYQSQSGGRTDFSLSLYAIAGFTSTAALTAAFMKVTFHHKALNLVSTFRTLLAKRQIAVVMAVATFLGIMLGALDGFLFWYVKQIGGDILLLGLCLGVGVFSEILLFFLSKKCVERFGEIYTLQISLLILAIRMTWYSFVSNPWYALPVQLLHGPSFSLMWVAASSYVSSIAPRGMVLTAQTLLGTLVYGIGFGSGNFVTGLLFEEIGPRWTLRIYGFTTAIVLMGFFATRKCFTQLPTQNDQEEMEMTLDPSPLPDSERITC